MEGEIKQILLDAGCKEVEKWGNFVGFAVQDYFDGVVVWPMTGHNYEWPIAADTIFEMQTRLYQMAMLPHREYEVTYCPPPRKIPSSVSSITVFKR